MSTTPSNTLGRTSQAALVLLLTALFLLGCEYPGIPRPAPGHLHGDDSENVSQEPAERQVIIALKDFYLDPDQVTVKSGEVTFSLRNEGRYTHDFRVEGQGVDARAPKVGAGRSLEWELTLEPGEYHISCPVSNHAERGMTGTLTVVE